MGGGARRRTIPGRIPLWPRASGNADPLPWPWCRRLTGKLVDGVRLRSRCSRHIPGRIRPPVMMNAELVARDEERIIIPTAYRTDYLGVLKAFSHNAHTDPLIRMLDVAQAYTHRIDWSTLDQARALLRSEEHTSELQSLMR